MRSTLQPLTDEERAKVEENYGLVVYIAKRHAGADDADDIRQEIALGLMEAVQRHDPDRGALSTSMAWRHRAAIQRHRRRRRWFSGTSHHKEPHLVPIETPIYEDITIGDTLRKGFPKAFRKASGKAFEAVTDGNISQHR